MDYAGKVAVITGGGSGIGRAVAAAMARYGVTAVALVDELAHTNVPGSPHAKRWQDVAVLLDAGIDDWGGVSPVTADHVNPERPWPDLDRLRDVTEARGFALAPRLTAYPEYLDDSLAGPERWVDPALRFAVLDRSDAESLGRDDPGSHHQRRRQARRWLCLVIRGVSGSGAHVPLVYSGVRLGYFV